ncbi:unnamed protein product, partial [Iphiclides podalirius]
MKTASMIQLTVLLSMMLGRAASRVLQRKPKGTFANFTVMNEKSVSDNGLIMNAVLSWGKWQQDEEDVTTINHIGFDSGRAANFTASGRDGSPTGAEGTFEIHEGGKKIAVVEFNIPFWGKNEFSIREVDGQYVCKQRGFTTDRSPTIIIKCRKISS